MKEFLRFGPPRARFAVTYYLAIEPNNRCEFFGRGAQPDLFSLFDFFAQHWANLDLPIGMSLK